MPDTPLTDSAAPAAQTGGVSLRADEIVVAGDVIGRDQIINHIQTIQARALTAAEAATQAQTLEAAALARGVGDFAQRLRRRADEAPATANPYRGLLTYRLNDAAVFFGRAQAIRQMLERLESGVLTVLHSESGAGKSSLLQAGLMPRLLVAGHLPVYVRPYEVRPDLALKRMFIPDLGTTPGLAQAPLRDFLRAVSAVLGAGARLYVFFDQFEEVFTQQSAADRAEFVRQFAECLDDPSLAVRWVLALRSEYFGHLANFRPPLQNPFGHDYRLERLTQSQAAEAVLAPAQQRGLAYEPGLVDAILADLGPAPYAPTEIQLVCSALCEELTRAGGQAAAPIGRGLYDELGGTMGILQNHVERVLTRDVSADRRPAAHRLLELLIAPAGRRLIRSRSDLLAELTPFNLGPAGGEALLAQLVDGRLVRRHEPKVNHPEPGFELAHDYLVSRITRDPAVQARRAAQALLDQEVHSFQQFGSLLSADELDVIGPRQAALTLSPKAAELIQKSRAALRRRRNLTVSGFGLAALLLVIGVLSGLSALAASDARAAAVTAQVAAETRAAAAALREADSQTQAAEADASRRIALTQQASSERAAATAITLGVQAQALAETADRRAEAAAHIARTLFEKNGLVPVEPIPGALAYDGVHLWVANELSGTVQAIDPTTGAIQATLAVGRAPRALLTDTRRLWVANTGDGTVCVIDTASLTITATWPSAGRQPTALAYDGQRLWVANADDDTVTARDADTGDIIHTLAVGPDPRALAWDGARVWVASFGASTLQPIDPATGTFGAALGVEPNPSALLFEAGQLWVASQTANRLQAVDTATGAIMATLDVGVRPVALAAGGDRLWVTVQGDNGVQVIDPALARVGALVPVGHLPRGLAFAAEGLWVANSGDNTVQVLDPSVGDLAAPVEIGAGPRALAVASDGQRLWVATQANRALQPFDLELNRLVTPRYFVGADPRAIFLEGPRLWVLSGENTLQSINLATGVINTAVRVGRDPRGVAFEGTRLWVANAGDDTIQPVNPQTRTAGQPIAVGDAPVAIVYDGLRLWVANSGDDTLMPVSPTSGQTGLPIPVGRAPSALLYDGRQLWVANRDDGTVQVVEPASGAVLATLPVGNAPVALAFDGRRVWVANFADNSVQAIEVDGQTFRSGKPVRVNSGPVALAFDGRRLWIASRDKNTLQALTIVK